MLLMAAPAARARMARTIAVPISDHQQADPIDQQGHQPGHRQLEQGHKAGPGPALGLLVDGGDGGGAGDIEQAEHHEAEGVQRPEADALEHGGVRKIFIDAVDAVIEKANN